MFCPKCRDEFVEGMTFCANCEVDLVDTLPDLSVFSSSEAMAQALTDKKLEPIMVGYHVALQEIQKKLASINILNIIAGETEEVQPGMHARFYLLIQQEDIASARAYFEAQWQEGLEIEGLMLDAADETQEIVDICPACQSNVDANQNECPECGLFIGSNE